LIGSAAYKESQIDSTAARSRSFEFRVKHKRMDVETVAAYAMAIDGDLAVSSFVS
jgi:hypothetical protein